MHKPPIELHGIDFPITLNSRRINEFLNIAKSFVNCRTMLSGFIACGIHTKLPIITNKSNKIIVFFLYTLHFKISVNILIHLCDRQQQNTYIYDILRPEYMPIKIHIRVAPVQNSRNNTDKTAYYANMH